MIEEGLNESAFYSPKAASGKDILENVVQSGEENGLVQSNTPTNENKRGKMGETNCDNLLKEIDAALSPKVSAENCLRQGF